MSATAQPPQDDVDTSMSFFITSAGIGDGANLGGLMGADAHCVSLAAAVGSAGKTWRAYLSTNGMNGIDARDRIGQGPWYNSDEQLVARSLADLHYSNVNFTKQTALNEQGNIVNGRGDQPNQHDILTGSNPDGSASEMTCNNWTSNAEDGSAMVGHFDRSGGGVIPESWNAAHPSRGCGQDNLIATGGNGYFFCFAQ
ncbi:MAG: hypothetical protein COA71_06065 [SAR86 cluster bacterium]|uniref:Lectin n=1 Tax=SAR86 cluster bacterium TaxID=2030880 RepID=A0A2A5CET6_9GAMM|nr:hypothetical protein [Gammaproteobacteria bacterium AH-315-E17]PCJ42253.1 MAG: hypothetical protein COA71_06065 [SAR86 cluster bacterium]